MGPGSYLGSISGVAPGGPIFPVMLGILNICCYLQLAKKIYSYKGARLTSESKHGRI